MDEKKSHNRADKPLIGREPRLPCVILAGGRAARMGGGDKVLLPLGRGRVIDYILAHIRPSLGPIALNANGDSARFANLGLAVLPDSLPNHPGPLAGVLAAMDWAAAVGFDRVITVAGDTPFVPFRLVPTLLEHARPSRPCLAAIHEPDGRQSPQPTFGLWPVDLRDRLRADLLGGVRKMRDWAAAQGATFAPFESDGVPFFNINTSEDLATAEAILEASADGRV